MVTSPKPQRAAAVRKFERRKEEIVRIAVQFLNSKGVRGTTLSEIAAKLDLVPTAVSYYFRRKEDLAAACFMQAIERYESFAATAATDPSPEVRLRAFLHSFADFFSAVEAGEAPAITAFNDVRTIRDAKVNAAYTEMFRNVRRLLPKRPDLSQAERNARAHLLISQAFWAVLWLGRYDRRDYRRMIDRMIDILLNGLVARPEAWTPRALDPEVQDEPTGPGASKVFLRAATNLINEEGYLGASVQKISAALNVTKGAFYYYNQAKDDLVAECFEATLSTMWSTLDVAEGVTETGGETVALVAASLVRNEVSGSVPLLRTSALTAVPEGLREEMILRFDRISARLSSLISDGIADGSLRAVDAHVAAQMVTAMINAGAELNNWAPGLTADEALLAYVRPLFLGLFTPGAVLSPGADAAGSA